jgi:hypothetical protein
MTGIDSKNDRVGGPRNDDRCGAQGLLSPMSRPEEVMTNNRTRLWKWRSYGSQNDFHRSLEISHRTRDSHIPTSRFLFLQMRRT